jgi:hypothetical protein
MLGGIADAFRSQEVPTIVRGLLRPIDVHALGRELNLKEHGFKERPASTETVRAWAVMLLSAGAGRG